MKNSLITKAIAYTGQRFFITILFTLIMLGPAVVVAQDDTTATVTTTVEAEEPELIAPGIEFISIQKADSSIDLKAVMQAKISGSFMKLPLLKVTFIQVIGEEEKELGFGITNQRGIVIFNCKPGAYTPDAEGKLHFKAIFAGNKQMESAEEEVNIKKARLEITAVKEDSVLSVQVKLADAVTRAPVPETTVGIYVKRMFHPLKVGEGTTDENGEAVVTIPANLPGDAAGNIIMTARIDENEVYGNLEAAATEKWGVPVSDKINKLPRALWSPHPPIWMLVTFIILMTTVWGHYIVIIYELFRLRKEEPATDSSLAADISS